MKDFFFSFGDKTVSGFIQSRYKRFLADITLDDGRLVVAHVPNSGSMATCWCPGARVTLTEHPDDGTRKLLYTLQAVEMPDGWVGVNTMNPNRAVAGAIVAGMFPELQGYDFLQAEVKAGKSRFDLCLFNQSASVDVSLLQLKPERAEKLRCKGRTASGRPSIAVIEIKNATMRRDNGVIFPDAVTERGRKHLYHLIELRKAGIRTVMLFFAGRSHTSWVSPADEIDRAYGGALREAINTGVEAMAVNVEVSAAGLKLIGTLPVIAG